MKIVAKGFLGAALIGVGIWIGSSIITSNADGGIDSQPGSVDDPIVTKSYVDQQVQQAVKDEIAKQAPAQSGTAAAMNVVVLKKGQVLYAGKGAQFIVRKGNAVAYSNDSNGIPNLTAGKDIPSGAKIDLNHLLLFPTDGGRGIKPAPTENNSIYVMVVGNYLLLNEDGSNVSP